MADAADARDDCFYSSCWTGTVTSDSRPGNNVESSKQRELVTIPSGKVQLAGSLSGYASGYQPHTARYRTTTKQVSSASFCFFFAIVVIHSSILHVRWSPDQIRELRSHSSLQMKFIRDSISLLYGSLITYLLSPFLLLDLSSMLCPVMVYWDLRRCDCLECFHLDAFNNCWLFDYD